MLIDVSQDADKGGEHHDDANQPGNREEARLASTGEASRMMTMTDAAQKKTPLYDEHVRLGAKMIPFGDWIMPVQYSGIIDEHQAVRHNVGVFDISHMGQLIATGPRAGAWLNEMLTNNIEKLEVGSGQYTFLLNER